MKQVFNSSKLIGTVLILVVASTQMVFAQKDPQLNASQQQAQESEDNETKALLSLIHI